RLGARCLPQLVLVRLAPAFVDPRVLAAEVGGRRALVDERIGAVLEDGHDGRNDAAGQRRGALVVLLDELAHVDAMRAERRADGRRSGCLARVDLHFDDGLDLLRHYFTCSISGFTSRPAPAGGLAPPR